MNRSRAPLWFALTVGILGLYWIYRTFVSPMTPQTTYYPITDFGRSTHSVYTFTNLLMLAIFIGIQGWYVYTLFRFQDDGSDELPEQTHGNTPLEIGFTAATFLLVIVLFIPSCQQISYQQGQIPDNALQVEVTGKQWWWEFYYPELDLVTANELHVPTGRAVNLNLTSSDVIHSFWVPRVGGKRDLVPGRSQNIWFTPEAGTEGVYEGQCAEYCGTVHALMSFELVISSPEDFQAWAAQQKTPNPEAAAGIGLFAANGCVACHMTMANDSSVRGLQGPNLAKIGTRRTIGAALMPNDTSNLYAWIKNPQAHKPGNLMKVANAGTAQCTDEGEPDACCTGPGIGNCLTDEQISQLVSYLQSLD